MSNFSHWLIRIQDLIWHIMMAVHLTPFTTAASLLPNLRYTLIIDINRGAESKVPLGFVAPILYLFTSVFVDGAEPYE